ncbi:MAG: hypothetical protein WDA18_09055 [Candidatus Ratteibacteria bacterium]|jgi:hypothetical protein
MERKGFQRFLWIERKARTLVAERELNIEETADTLSCTMPELTWYEAILWERE